MCGIVGIVGKNSPAFGGLQNALDAISHRGPDGEGIWRDRFAQLGHRRLAVIDLTKAGAQPMRDEQSGLIITFNGEIYNHLELRHELQKKGHVFRSKSDTETLLIGYKEWGKNILERANGMYAFVIWDSRSGTAFAARDRFGVKPLYYSIDNGVFCFASEPKALHEINPALLNTNKSTIVNFFINSVAHHGSETFFKNIRALPPGHLLKYNVHTDTINLERYWHYSNFADQRLSSGNPVEEFDCLFEDAVKIRFRSDVPVGLTLSGGIDSSAIVAAASTQGLALKRAYTAVFSSKEQGEFLRAKHVTDIAGVELSAVISPIETWDSLLSEVVDHMDSPGFSPSVLPLWDIMKQSRKDGVTVMLEGQGADEVLGGYPYHMALNAADNLSNLSVKEFVNSVRGLSAMTSKSMAAAWMGRILFPGIAKSATSDKRLGLINSSLLQNLSHDGFRSDNDRWDRGNLVVSDRQSPKLLNRLIADCIHHPLPSLLHYGDIISMAHGVESRLPFLDYRLFEWVLKKRPALLAGGVSKRPVRGYLGSRGFSTVAQRREKLGFPVPLLEWWSKVGKERLFSVMQDNGSGLWEIFDLSEVRKLAQNASRGNYQNLFHIYKVVSTEAWLRQLRIRSGRLAGSQSKSSRAF